MNSDRADPRAICNFMLDEADRRGRLISNLALQKLLYFAHAHYLVSEKRPLVYGYFEAWKYGPVHPTAYKAFKDAGDKPIDFRATRQNPLTGKIESIEPISDRLIIDLLEGTMRAYGFLTPRRLVDLSHAKGAPWHSVVERGTSGMAFGLRISDDVIRERFKYHKVSVTSEPTGDDPGEDTPFA